jgi:hypothetical protein
MQHRRFKNILSFPDRLDQEIERLRAEAEKLPPGNREREMLLRKARQAETALHINDWLSSPGLQAPSKAASMAEYRAYIIGHDGHFVDFTPLVCPDDAEAIEKAKRLVNGRDVEIWSGARFVIKLEADPK